MDGENTEEFVQRTLDKSDKVSIGMGLEKGQGLGELIEQSEIEQNPYGKEAAERLMRTARVVMAPELVWLMKHSQSSEKPKNPYVLGMDYKDADVSFKDRLELDGNHFVKAHADVGVSEQEEGHTQKLMERLTSSGRDIVMLVPPQLYSSGKSKHTKAEIEWLLEHPDRAGRVVLCFGAYDYLVELDENGSYWEQKDEHTKRVKDMVGWVEDVFGVEAGQKLMEEPQSEAG